MTHDAMALAVKTINYAERIYVASKALAHAIHSNALDVPSMHSTERNFAISSSY